MALSSILDSEATFEQQAQEVGLPQPWIDALKAGSLATFAKLSFAITSPGTVATDEQVNRFLNGLRGGIAASIAELSAFKRLLFESQTMMMHRFKSVAKGDEGTPKRMAPPERDARLARQRAQLRGLDISGPMEPAHGLYDMCAAMIEKNEIAYISPTKCLSRQQELLGNKPEKEIQLDATKTALVIREQPSTTEINITSDLALYQALQRRALAMDLTGLATFEISKKWIDRMFAIYSQPPAPGFQKVSQAQILRADRQSFVRLNEMFTGSLKSAPMAGLPLDALIESSTRTCQLLTTCCRFSPVKLQPPQTRWTRSELSQHPNLVHRRLSIRKVAKGRAKGRNVSQYLRLLKGCIQERHKAILFALATILELARIPHVSASTCVQFRDATKATLRRSINELQQRRLFHPMRPSARPQL